MSLTSEQLDGLTELINLGVGRGASALNEMLNTGVELQIPALKVVSSSEFHSLTSELGKQRYYAVNLPFTGKFSGSAELIFKTESIDTMVMALTGENQQTLKEDIESLREETLCEVGNIVLNGVMGAIGNVLKQPLNFSSPIFSEGDSEELLDETGIRQLPVVLIARTRFIIRKFEIEGDIILFFEDGSFNALLEGLVLSGIMTGS